MKSIYYMAPIEAMSGKFAKQAVKITRPRALGQEMNYRKVQYFGGSYSPSRSSKWFFFKNAVQKTIPTADQELQMQNFTTAAATVASWYGSAQIKEEIIRLFKNQSRCKTLRGFAMYLALSEWTPPTP